MSNQKRKILVTCALPYANGALHLGHILEYVQADIWVRFQQMHGHDCLSLCASDCHGTPIMLQAERSGCSPEALVTRISELQRQDVADFSIAFDNFHTTHSEENRRCAEQMYHQLQSAGAIVQREIKQAYDPEKAMFLPDRFVKGECPRCGAADQYGDNCESCGATYSPVELKNARSVISGAVPVEKNSQHLFFDLPRYEQALKAWTTTDHLQSEVVNKLEEWFKAGLRQWDISRDAPYFGFTIPGMENKYFYVWLDAPIGYLASLMHLCQRRDDINFDDYWQLDSDAELYHFIGKDVLYFHTLFWPAMLMAAAMRTPTAVYVHGFLTVNGAKMSKSRGTFIKARTYLNHLDSDYLRYYFAAKLSCHVDDIDLNFTDFRQRVNADLVGKVVNIASRTTKILHSYFDNFLGSDQSTHALWQQFIAEQDNIAEAYESRQYAKAIREIMALTDHANQAISEAAPWQAIKNGKREAVQAICTLAINCFRLLMTWLKPVVPELAQRSEQFLNAGELLWEALPRFLCDHQLAPFKPLLQRIKPEEIEAMNDEAKKDLETVQPPQQQTAMVEETASPFKPEITIDDFMKVDLRVATVVTAQAVEGAEKLLQLTLDIGGIERQVFAGLKKSYAPESLIGRQVVVVANLKPRKMRFGLSQGMVIAAGSEGGERLWLVSPEVGAEAGDAVK
ncbi:MAG: methionine--tRNA ligase [Gammaproteobacteria bacterium]|nr:methionine--tRNA ligase [Gammaproteobacteria bacterium]